MEKMQLKEEKFYVVTNGLVMQRSVSLLSDQELDSWILVPALPYT
jgi:hypothetical protein